MENEIVSFQFTVADANAILSVLGNAPYVQVAGIIANMQAQAAPQIANFAPAEEVATEEVATEEVAAE
jgi:hypothetical protein